MKKTILLLSAAFITVASASAQEGKPSVKIFSNFNYDMSTEEDENAFKAFEIKRAYLGYSYKIDDQFSTEITFDVGKNDKGSSYTAFLKIASLQWKACDELSINFGMVGTKNFKFMEGAWGRRYVEKSALDKYKWASSADVGVTADYTFSDKISLDAQVINGEGFNKLQASNGLFRGGLGLTYKVNESLSLRVQQDLSPRSSYDDMSASQTITTGAISYTSNNITIGAETNMMRNSLYVKDAEQDMMSIYGAYKMSDKYTVFARHDDASKTNEQGSFTVYGIERKMAKGVTVALNMQSWTDSAEGSEAENTLFLNLEYKF